MEPKEEAKNKGKKVEENLTEEEQKKVEEKKAKAIAKKEAKAAEKAKAKEERKHKVEAGEQVDDPNAKRKEKEAEKAAKRAARSATDYVKDPNDPSAALFGEMELNRSQMPESIRFEKKYTKIQDLKEENVGQ